MSSLIRMTAGVIAVGNNKQLLSSVKRTAATVFKNEKDSYCPCKLGTTSAVVMTDKNGSCYNRLCKLKLLSLLMRMTVAVIADDNVSYWHLGLPT